MHISSLKRQWSFVQKMMLQELTTECISTVNIISVFVLIKI